MLLVNVGVVLSNAIIEITNISPVNYVLKKQASSH